MHVLDAGRAWIEVQACLHAVIACVLDWRGWRRGVLPGHGFLGRRLQVWHLHCGSRGGQPACMKSTPLLRHCSSQRADWWAIKLEE